MASTSFYSLLLPDLHLPPLPRSPHSLGLPYPRSLSTPALGLHSSSPLNVCLPLFKSLLPFLSEFLPIPSLNFTSQARDLSVPPPSSSTVHITHNKHAGPLESLWLGKAAPSCQRLRRGQEWAIWGQREKRNLKGGNRLL